MTWYPEHKKRNKKMAVYTRTNGECPRCLGKKTVSDLKSGKERPCACCSGSGIIKTIITILLILTVSLCQAQTKHKEKKIKRFGYRGSPTMPIGEYKKAIKPRTQISIFAIVFISAVIVNSAIEIKEDK